MHVVWWITTCGLCCLQVRNLLEWAKSCRILTNKLVGQGFEGISVCLPLAGHIPDLGCDRIDQLVGNITIGAFIAFSNEEIPSEGRRSTKALHITIKCKNYIMPQPLLENGSFLNVILMSTLSTLPIDLSYMKKSQMVVWAFDGTKREVLGNIELPIQVRQCTLNSKFIVMDINPSYICLLGRPWIHMVGTVPLDRKSVV